MTMPDSHADTARRAWIRRPGVLAALASVGIGLVAFILGAVTDLSLGDENYHFRKAAHFAEQGRLAHDPDYGSLVPPGIPYYDGPLWHYGLGMLWRVTGQSMLVAQLYQAAWILLLGVSAWYAGRALAGDRAGWWTMALAITFPSALYFGAVLYVEVAIFALLMLAAALALARRPLLAGLAFGLAFLVKPTVTVAFPGLLLGVLFMAQGSTWRRLWRVALAGAGAALVIAPDLIWRQLHFGTVGVVFLSKSGGDAAVPEAVRAMLREIGPATFYWAMSLFTPRILAVSLGLVLPLGVIVAIGFWKRLGRKATALWTVTAVVVAPEAALLAAGGYQDVRYWMPALVPPVLVAGMGLAVLAERRRGWRNILMVLAIVQGLGVLGAVYVMRQVDPATRDAMRELGRLEVRRPPGFVVCPEASVSTYSDRPILWAAINPGAFFFNWSPAKQWFLLDYFGAEYIAIPADKVYDDAAIRHTGGYPRSFVRALPHMPYVDPQPVIDRPGLKVYRVRPKPPANTSIHDE